MSVHVDLEQRESMLLHGANDSSAELQSAEVARLLSAAAEDSIGDFYGGKRQQQRFRSAAAFELEYMHDGMREVVPVGLQDISATGLACWAKVDLPEESHVFLREFTNDDSGMWLSARITHCTRGIRGNLLGAAFEHPADEEMLALLEAEHDAPTVELPKPSFWQRVRQALGFGS